MYKGRALSLLALGLALAGATEAAARGPVAKPAKQAASSVSIKVPSPSDYALALIDLPRGSSTVGRVTVQGPYGADYVAAAELESAPAGHPRLLVFVLNRATDLLDPTSVQLSLHVRGADHPRAKPRIVTVRDGLGARQGSTPALCKAETGSSPLTPEGLAGPFASVGTPLSGFSAPRTLAQGYDLSCGLAYEASFEEAVRSSSTCPPCNGSICVACEPTVPRCPPCAAAKANFVCPLAAMPIVCGAFKQ